MSKKILGNLRCFIKERNQVTGKVSKGKCMYFKLNIFWTNLLIDDRN